MAFSLTFSPYPEADSPVAIAPVPWDSDFFGFPFHELKCADASPDRVARHLPAWLAEHRQQAPLLMVTRIPPAAIAMAQALTAVGFYPVETLLDMHFPLSRFKPIIDPPPKHLRLRRATPDDLPFVLRIATSTFSTDRFHLDPNLPSDKADRRYASWVENVFRGQEPTYILEDRRGPHVVGFTYIHDVGPKIFDMSLAGVDPEHLNSGAGVVLYQLMMVECRALGYKSGVSRISINNLNALKLSLRLGCTIRGATLVLHYFRPTGAL